MREETGALKEKPQQALPKKEMSWRYIIFVNVSLSLALTAAIILFSLLFCCWITEGSFSILKIPFYFLPICVIFFPLTVLSYYVLYQIIKMKNEAGGKSPSQYLSISNEGRKKRQLVLRLMLIILDFMVLGFYLGIFIKLIQVSLSLAIDLYSKEINIGSTVNYSIAYIGIILLIFSPVYLFNKLSFFCPNCQRRLHKFPLSRNLEASIKGEFVCQNCGFKYSIFTKDEERNEGGNTTDLPEK